MPRREVTDDLELLLAVLPEGIRSAVHSEPGLEDLIEVVLDLGRLPEARFPGRSATLGTEPVGRSDLDHVVNRVGAFTEDNRAGIERTLHRISAIRNRRQVVVGLTCRVGRAILGTVDILRDVIESGSSLLLLGRPGVGKTTLLRESARVLSAELGKRVIVVDTSNEIAGDGDIPHSGIGSARRMQVPRTDLQHAVMIEAVENHMPEVIVIDEIGTVAEASAARTIAERGVQLIATAHGNSLDNLLMNPTLADLLGGIHAVTLSDEEARRRGTQKTVLERKAPPTFDTLVEIQDRENFAVYHDTASVVDGFLRGRRVRPEQRVRHDEGFRIVKDEAPPAEPRDAVSKRAATREGSPRSLRIYPYGISRDRLARAIHDLDLPVSIVRSSRDANLVLTLKAHEKRQPNALIEFADRGLEVVVIRSNTVNQMKSLLQDRFGLSNSGSEENSALVEADEAVSRVLSYGKPVELAPRAANVRRLQHELVEKRGLGSESRGESPWRRVIVMPTRG